MTLAGTAITKVGLRPLHSVLGPSFLAIFRIPSNVLVKVLLCASSAAHAEAEVIPVLDMTVMLGVPATQYGALLLTQKTSRQQEDMPRLGGKFVKDWGFSSVEPFREEVVGT
jgi:hypothetical protein